MKSLLLAPLACASLALSQSTGQLGNAAITQNNPSGVSYTATLPSGNGIQGYVEGTSNDNGTGVMFNVNFYQFPDASLGPFRKQPLRTSYQAVSLPQTLPLTFHCTSLPYSRQPRPLRWQLHGRRRPPGSLRARRIPRLRRLPARDLPSR